MNELENGGMEGIETKELSALDTVPSVIKRYNMLKQAKELSTDNYVTFGGKMGDAQVELRMLLPIAIDEINRKIETSKKFGDVSELEATKEEYEKLLLTLPEEKKQVVQVSDDFDRAVGNEYGGAINKMDKRI